MWTKEEWIERYSAALGTLSGEIKIKLVPEDEQASHNEKLRPSSIGSCARQQAYRVSGALALAIDGPATSWQVLMGYVGQGVLVETLKAMSYVVEDEEKEVYYKNFTGHVDGIISGGDLGNERAIWDAKVFSAYRFRSLLAGLPEGDGTIYLQQQVYIAGEDTERGLVTVVPSDLSTNRSLMRQYKREGDPRVNPIWIEADKEALEIVDDRYDEITFAVENNLIPQREYDPMTARFPCPFCEFKNICILEGDTAYVVRPLPEHYGR